MVAVHRDLRQTDGWAKYLQSLGWEVEEIPGPERSCKIYIRKVPLIGAVVKLQRPAAVPPAEEIDRIAKEHRALFVKLEPSRPVSMAGFEPDRNPNLPTKTVVIDLTRSGAELWEDLSKDARQSIRKAVGNQLTAGGYQPGDEGFSGALANFQRLLQETGGRQGFRATSLQEVQKKAAAFEKDTLIFVVRQDGRPVAAALIIFSGNAAFFHHLGSKKSGQKLFATYFLVWEVLKEIKKRRPDVRILDLEGVDDPRFPQTKSWQKFSVFKRKWGGEEIEYPPPLIKYFNPLVRALFKLTSALT